MKNLIKTAIVCCALAALLCSCPNDTGGNSGNSNNDGPVINYDMTGTYTFTKNNNECTWVFTSNGTYEVSGYGIVGTKTGTWSAKGNDITISYASGAVSGSEIFTVKKNGEQLTLSLKDNSAQISNLLVSLGVAAKTVTLTKGGNGNGNQSDYNMAGTYTFTKNNNECTWIFKTDGNYEVSGYGITGTKTGTWSVKGNDITISYGSGAVSGSEVFTVQRSGNQVTLTIKDSSAPISNLLVSLGVAAKSVSLTKAAYYIVTFDADNGSPAPQNQEVDSGDKVNQPPAMTKNNAVFEGWYREKTFTTKWNFDTDWVYTNITLYAKWNYTGSLPLTSISGVTSYLAAQSGGGYYTDPLNLPISLQLSEDNWNSITSAISSAGKYVALDLSLCTRSNSSSDHNGLNSSGSFSIGYNNQSGEVVSIIFPNTTSIIFPNTTTKINNCYSFNLVSVSFPASVSFEGNPFLSCYSLVSFNLSGSGALSVIENGKALVQNNTELVAYPSASGDITLNHITSIGRYAFDGCWRLISVSLPATTEIGEYAFQNCSNLTNVSLPAAISIGDYVFSGCYNLDSVSLPAATTIGDYAFNNCTNLDSVSLPAATSIGKSTFRECSSLSSIILGIAAPTVGSTLFDDISFSQTVTVKIPAGATGYGSIPQTYSGSYTTENWGNGFRGGGWTGTGFINAYYINSNITLVVEYQQ